MNFFEKQIVALLWGSVFLLLVLSLLVLSEGRVPVSEASGAHASGGLSTTDGDVAQALLSLEGKLTPADAVADDRFGYAVAIDGNTAVVGTGRKDNFRGAAYIFVQTDEGWSQQAKLTADDAAQGDLFGWSVALEGDTAVIGAYGNSDSGPNSGSAYIFVRDGDTWGQQAKLTAMDAATEDRFGHAVALSGDTAVVGAINDDDGGLNSGSAYVFTRNGDTWSEQAKLTASDAASADLFGWSVGVAGNTAVVGAYGDDDKGSFSGSAYVFVRLGENWQQQTKLTASDGQADDLFGITAAIDGDTAVIGAYGNDDNGNFSGAAYVFVRISNQWQQQAKLIANDGNPEDRFGFAVALANDVVVVGANYAAAGASNSGAAYVFVRANQQWSQQAKLVAPDAAADDQFAHAVAVSGDIALVGALLDDDHGLNSGSAYLFRVPTTPAPPVATPNRYTIAEENVLMGGNVINDDTGAGVDTGSGSLTVMLDQDVNHGALTLKADGSFSYTPAANFHGVDTFAYVLSDTLLMDTAVVTITVTAVNDAPIATADAYTTTQNTTLVINAPGLLHNDNDIDGDPLTALQVTPPASGTLELNGDGSLTYTPATGFAGRDSFTYRVSDDTTLSAVATVTLHVLKTGHTLYLPMIMR